MKFCNIIILLIAAILFILTCSNSSAPNNSDNGNDDDTNQNVYQKPNVMIDNGGNIICNREYGDHTISPYILPYPPGKWYEMAQSPCYHNGGHVHQLAYDFRMDMGDTLIATRSGYIRLAIDQYSDDDHTPGHNNRVFIEHVDGAVSWYAHVMQNSIMVSLNQYVDQGQPIALCGNSGNSIWPHFHMQIFYNLNYANSFNNAYCIPFNFNNTNQDLDANNALIMNTSYRAAEFDTLYEIDTSGT